ncbi:MAG: hypothetical protein HZB19_14035 [Chloroflexi bacterium]|nr:hypothetical protein [Chloroflexota bacterium]
MTNLISSNSQGDEMVLDFSNGIDLNQEFKAPIRFVELRVGNVLCRIPRSADDETPDDIVFVGGVYINLKDGRIGQTKESVNGYHP